MLRCPAEALAQALRVLVDNSLDASDGPVVVTTLLRQGELVLQVRDAGPGMSTDVLQRVFEPFFTTKPTGKGMGLGLFLARNVATRLDGSLSLKSTPGVGTEAELTLPKSRLRT